MSLDHQRHTPPQAPPSFDNLTPDSLLATVDLTIAQSASLQEHLVNTLKPATATFGSLIRPLIDDRNIAGCVTGPFIMLERVASDTGLREAAREAHKRVDAADTKTLLRFDLAELVNAVYRQYFDKDKTDDCVVTRQAEMLSNQDLYLLKRLNTQFTISGANVKEVTKRARLSVIKAEVDALVTAAQKDFTEFSDRDGLWLTQDELEGMPERWLSTLRREICSEVDQPDRPRYWVTFKESHYLPILRNATWESTRRKAYLAKTRRFPQNVARLQRIVGLRDEIARIIGFVNHAELRVKERMARSVIDIERELNELKTEILPLAAIEVDVLKELKGKDAETARTSAMADCEGVIKSKENSTGIKYHVWDRQHYEERLKRENYAIDSNKLSEYFEASQTIDRMLSVFERLFGLKFERVERASTWHQTVSLYSVWDAENDRQGEFLGYLYLDIFGRQGKTQQQYHSAIQPTFTPTHGGRHYPVSALILPFPVSAPERPSLLQHRDVKIMFHELGHAVHHLVDRTTYGISHSRDYAEIPSRLLEHLIWQPEVLIKLGKHYSALPQYKQEKGIGRESDTDEGLLPLTVAQDVYRTKHLGEAHGMATQLSSALFDLALYTTSTHEEALGINTTALWNTIKGTVLPYDRIDEEDQGFGQAEWSPAFRNTDAGYYTYVQSTAYAADLFASEFSAVSLDDSEPPFDAWRRWRRQVLERGSGESELALLESFLGRKMNVKTASTLIARAREAKAGLR